MKLNEILNKEIKIGTAVKAIGTAAVGAYMALVNAIPALAANLNVELMYGNNQTTEAESLTLDTKASGKLIAGLGYFFRNRTTMGLEENTVNGSFTCAELNYKIVDGLAVLAAVKAVPGQKYMPRGGFKYLHKFGENENLSIFLMLTHDLSEGIKTDVLADVGYTLPIRTKWGVRFGLEEAVTFTDGGPTTDISRIRAGITYKVIKERSKWPERYQEPKKTIISAGAAVDINDIADRKERVFTPGAYVSVKF